MSAAAEARLGALDKVLDQLSPSAALGDELFAVVDALGGSPSLRRALTDSTASEAGRREVVRQLFGGRVSEQAVSVVEAAVGQQWSTSGSFVSAIERQGVRAVLSEVDRAGRLDATEDELFKLGRAVDANPALREALGERAVDVKGRQALIDDVFGGKVSPAVLQLARRAVVARERTFALTLDRYLQLAADLRRRGIALVEVARPLTAEQESRLRAALSKQAGRELTLNVVVNPAVLGGVRVSMGDEIIEGTVAGRLSDVRRKLS